MMAPMLLIETFRSVCEEPSATAENRRCNGSLWCHVQPWSRWRLPSKCSVNTLAFLWQSWLHVRKQRQDSYDKPGCRNHCRGKASDAHQSQNQRGVAIQTTVPPTNRCHLLSPWLSEFTRPGHWHCCVTSFDRCMNGGVAAPGCPALKGLQSGIASNDWLCS
jgi:hypothetical protein